MNDVLQNSAVSQDNLVLYVEQTGGMWWCSWLRHYTKSWKVAGLIPDRVIGTFH
jgi:hypothetical protein